ncbi:MAG: membrane-bound lytic murein transglycosylase MltF [Deltaproteobacteria bacterium]|nr:membrane-bound lytic murein transglycosylase MltF [Deltaproteobacteria bacterium]
MKRLHSFLMVPIIGLLILGVSCEFDLSSFNTDAPVLTRIIKKGELTVITRNNAHCYYSYRDQEMGFEHDLAKAFASYLGVSLNIRIAHKWEGMIPSLIDDTGDLIAASMTITPKRKREVLFSNGYMDIQQHLIVNRDNHTIRTLEDLPGQAIHIRRGTSYQERLESLATRIPDLTIVLHDNVPTEELIRRVAEKEIAITVADSNIALLNRRYYPQAILGPPVGKNEQLGWAVKPEARDLRAKINQFFKHIQENGVYGDLFRQYYAEVERFDYVDMRVYHRRLATRLPKYQPILMAAAREFDFDWRLIAAQMYQESHFRRYARSHAGAYGLMQLTKRTAESFGVTDITDPEQNIYAGVQHLRNLFTYFDIENESDRQAIALAAYNIGQGHVRDAQKLAISLRMDPQKWSSLEKTLPLLKQQKYYNNATYGYCEGLEPVTYVNQIRIYYDILKRQAIDYDERH